MWRDERGSNLVELTIVVAILSILVSIAVAFFVGQRVRAADAASVSDLRNAAISMEAYATRAGEYGGDALDAFGFTSSRDVDVVLESVTSSTFCVTATHRSSGQVFEVRQDGQPPTEGECI